MATINVSIPDKLKEKAEKLIADGYYASFSDVVRHSLRRTIETNVYDLLGDQAEIDYAEGRTTSLKTDEDIENFVNNLSKNARTSANRQLHKTSRKADK